MFESFRYLYRPDYDVSDADVLTHKYRTRDDLGGRFVVRRESTARATYRVYDSMDAFWAALDATPEADRMYHEVIFSGPQKLKFDVDASTRELAAMPREPGILDDAFDSPLHAAYSEVITAILEAVDITYFTQFHADAPAVIVCESAGELDKTKMSNHIIIDGVYVSSHTQAAEFTQRVKSVLAPIYWPFLDMGVNKRTQNFRIVGNHKPGSDRVKRVTTGHPRENTLITNTDGCVRLDDITAEKVDEPAPPPDDIDAILRVCEADPDFAAHRFKCAGRNSMIMFERVAPSLCSFCTSAGNPTEHTRDDTMYVWAPSRNGVTTVFKYCRRYVSNHPDCPNRRIRVGEVVSAQFVPEGESSPVPKSTWIDRQIAAAVSEPLVAVGDPSVATDLFARLRGQLVYDEPALKPFDPVPTLVVRAAMKMGKTKALAQHITAHYPPVEHGALGHDPVIRFVSFRQTFSANIKEKFPDFTLYSDVRGPLTQPRLIVQVESLHRLYVRDGSEPPDLLILDECESIFEQFDSGLLRGNFNRCWSMFRYLLAYSKHVICMDANAGDRTYRILHQLRAPFRSAVAASEPVLHWCQWRNATDDKYFVTGDKLRWLGMLYANVEADEKIAVPSSSLAEAKVLQHNLTARYPSKTIRLYSSETLSSEKREHFSNVHEYWVQCDVLIYTPTVSAGVSFELKHFTRVFGYFTDQSCPVETCLQMIGRIRDVSAHEYFVCLSASGNNLPTRVEDISTWLTDKRRHLSSTFDETGLVVTIGPDGKTSYSGDFLAVWLENTRMKNISANSFVRHLIMLIRGTGASVSALTEDIFIQQTGVPSEVDGALNDDLADIDVEHRIARGRITQETAVRIASAPELTLDAAEEIRAKMVAREDVTIPERAAYEKHRLRVDYRFNDAIDARFVVKYADAKVRRQYKNLSRLSPDTDGRLDIDAALERIRLDELATHKYFLGLGEAAEASDIVRKYVFDQHRYALGLLRMCGWLGLDDPQLIHADNIVLDTPAYWSTIGAICTEFRCRRPSASHARTMAGLARTVYLLKPVNSCLTAMYGVAIVAPKGDPVMFYLRSSGLFTADPDAARRRGVPLISAVEEFISPAPVMDELEELACAILDM